MKIHVFVDDGNNVVSTSPATTSPDSEQSARSGDILLGNAVSAQQGARITRYELDLKRDLALDLDQLGDVIELHKKCVQAIQNGTAKKL